jgi:hypothetical protein
MPLLKSFFEQLYGAGLYMLFFRIAVMALHSTGVLLHALYHDRQKTVFFLFLLVLRRAHDEMMD